jgi:predicted nucleotidyltransferase
MKQFVLQDKPKWFTKPNYLTVMGSRAYGVHNENSDWDFYGFVVPPLDVIFPHLRSEIPGFGRQKQGFEQIQAQHLQTKTYGEIDVTIYSIVKYFHLLMEGNPNIIDSIFTKGRCVEEMDEIGLMVSKNRHLFLSQKCYHTFKGMMWSHLARIKSGRIKEGRKNQGFDWDVKDGYHSVRMALQLKQILFEGDLDLEAHIEPLKKIRNGEYSKDYVIAFCEAMLKEFEERESEFILPYEPDEKKIKELLVACIETHHKTNLQKVFGK